MREIFFKDFGWKLFSSLLAVFIWFTVHKLIEEPGPVSVSSNTSLVTYSNLPVYFIATATDISVYHVEPGAVAVTVSGPNALMELLATNQIRATVDLTDMEPGRDSDERVDVSVPPGVTVFSVVPPRVKVVAPPKH
ncbi:MAG TPA: CdaR family protein [Verrucomicrobiae bacterium]